MKKSETVGTLHLHRFGNHRFERRGRARKTAAVIPPQQPARQARRFPDRIEHEKAPVGFEHAVHLAHEAREELRGDVMQYGDAHDQVEALVRDRHLCPIAEDAESVRKLGAIAPQLRRIAVETDVRAARATLAKRAGTTANLDNDGGMAECFDLFRDAVQRDALAGEELHQVVDLRDCNDGVQDPFEQRTLRFCGSADEGAADKLVHREGAGSGELCS